MKKLIKYIAEFHVGYFYMPLYLVSALFIALIIWFNYHFNFENGVIDSYSGSPLRALWFFMYHGIVYITIIGIILLFSKEKLKLNKEFWWRFFIGFLILSTERASTFHTTWIWNNCHADTRIMLFKSIDHVLPFFLILLPLLFIKSTIDKKEKYGLYGLRVKEVNFKPYWTMLLIMVPIVFMASLTKEFQNFYPTYKRAGGELFANHYGIEQWQSALFFETFYVSRFLYVELFFRGFLVIGMAKCLGRNAILPMAATYAVLHFGKPLGETISSVVGGYILGILALYSKNIWGGVFIHGGVALLMEVFAFLALTGLYASLLPL